ncbi:oxidoreductase molybdopterin binding [Methylocella silvestris BL2]|uniref:Oxidoreductase molybdopterin binding n=1 Tax=Methylocella silvestris (strain DSM 15510 / CIP 108128 / LMG 27833 / NCIMB 13906 / BL2) TaxID=395965 RepID=B8EKD5_METSB|nr:molybdopterin-dependent oxidoreductase [Methylocella silvestris]ACK50675.1 oxidoreductase molybdopterin binding [Methylocella silvestris BL2]
MRFSVALISLALLAASPSQADEANVSVALTGLDGQAGAVTLDELAALPRATVSAEQHGAAHAFEGALLTDILARVGAPSGKAIHGAEMTDVIIVEARDGYKIALDLAGTDATIRKDRVILADRMDGAPIGPETGPFRLVVEGDLRPARSVRMVKQIRLERLH